MFVNSVDVISCSELILYLFYFIVAVPCSSDEGDLDQLLGEDDYSNAENPDHGTESKEENNVVVSLILFCSASL